VFVDSKTVPFHGLVNFYVSGWANDDNFDVKGFFIARGTVNITSSPPSLAIMWDRDISTGIVKVSFFVFFFCKTGESRC
jgi:hypothetical protein